MERENDRGPGSSGQNYPQRGGKRCTRGVHQDGQREDGDPQCAPPTESDCCRDGARAAMWAGVQAMRQSSKMLLGDLNETFLRTESHRQSGETLKHRTARGALLLQWLGEQDMQAPEQDIATPTYHPHNCLR